MGTQIGLGWGRQNERDGAMVKDPPTDLEEVVGGITVDPSGRSQDPWGILETVLPVCGPLVSHLPDGDYSDRTNPADLCSTQ